MRRLFAPCDCASIVLFRIAFGAILFWEALRFYYHDRIYWDYIAPPFHFTYYGFEWVVPWSGQGMHMHLALFGIAAIGVMIGFLYRFSALLLFLTFSYIFLLDQALYLNHFYLVALLSFLMIFVPAHRAFSVDAWLWQGWRADFIPLWALWLMRIQVGIPYFYGGIAKLNQDWLRGEPLRTWLASRGEDFFLGSYFTQEWVVYFFTYGGLIFDLGVVPLLLWRKTRAFAFLCALAFNLTNAWLFDIGIFPWLMICATTLFFEPDWPRRWLGMPPTQIPSPRSEKISLGKKAWLVFLGVYLFFQLTLPFRHFFYPGVVHWNEEGHRFAWHMKLRDKEGLGLFYLVDPLTQERHLVNPEEWLTERQHRKMVTRPDMILQFAHDLARSYQEQTGRKPQVFVDLYVSLNNREYRPLIDPREDLASKKRTLGHADWVLPLENP